MGRLLVLAGAGASGVLTLLAMILSVTSGVGKALGTLDMILFIIGSVVLVALAALAIVLMLLRSDERSTPCTLKGIGIILAVLVYFSNWGGLFGTGWWFFILAGDMLIYLGAMTMQGQVAAEPVAEPEQQPDAPSQPQA